MSNARYPGGRWPIGALSLLLGLIAPTARAEEAPRVEFRTEPGKIVITAGGEPLATYVDNDATITRPYFAHLHAPGGVQVTRNQPPVEGKDPTDHATFHPGLWMAFGDLSGADSWRLRARVVHERFAEQPHPGPGRGTFAVVNRYLAPDGKTTRCTELARYTVHVRPAGYLLVWESEFRPEPEEFSFNDQEEMGLGVRLATPLTVKHGQGRLTDSAGRSGEKDVRGHSADWCDGSGTVDGREAGVTVMTDPSNFRPSWFHARDYGLIVANPFGRKALTGGPTSRVVVGQGQTLRLGFGVLLHSGKPVDHAEAYRDYLRLIGRSPQGG
jgi:hypothetical protein